MDKDNNAFIMEMYTKESFRTIDLMDLELTNGDKEKLLIKVVLKMV
jgi:hypothetical protein